MIARNSYKTRNTWILKWNYVDENCIAHYYDINCREHKQKHNAKRCYITIENTLLITNWLIDGKMAKSRQAQWRYSNERDRY